MKYQNRIFRWDAECNSCRQTSRCWVEMIFTQYQPIIPCIQNLSIRPFQRLWFWYTFGYGFPWIFIYIKSYNSIHQLLTSEPNSSLKARSHVGQQNALVRISKHLNINSRRTVYNSFIMRKINHCKSITKSLNRSKKGALRILFVDYNSSYLELLRRAPTTTLLLQRLRLIVLTVFKSLHLPNPPCLNEIFTPK